MRTKILIVILVPLLLLSLYYPPLISGMDGDEVDGAILSEIFIKVVELAESGKPGGALNLIDQLVNTSLPTDLTYLHRSVYRDLKELISTISVVDGLLRNLSESPSPGIVDRVRAELLNLYGLRLNIEDRLREYVDTLLKYVRPEDKTYYRSLLEGEVEDFLGFVDNFVVEAADTLRDFQAFHGLGVVDLELVTVPDSILAGEMASVRVSVTWLNESRPENISIVVSLGVGWRTLAKYIFPMGNSSSLVLGLPIPSTRDLARLGVTLSGEEPLHAYCLVTLYGYVGGVRRVLDTAVFQMDIVGVRPNLDIRVPRTHRYGEDLEISIYSYIEYATNLTLMIDGVEYGVSQIFPGSNRLVIPSSNISKGMHTLVFEVDPVAMYTGYRYSVSLDVLGRPVEADLTYSSSYVWPVESFKVSGNVGDGGALVNYLWIYLGDRLVWEGVLNSSFDMDIYLPPPLLVSVERLRLVVGPDDPYYDPYVVEVEVVEVNLVGLLGFALIGLLGIYVDVTFERGVVLRSIESGLRRLRGRASRGHEGASKFRELVVAGIVKSRVAAIYWGFVERFSRVFSSALAHETLREYLARVRGRLFGEVSSMFEELTLLVERDLYSREAVDESLVRRLVRRIRDELG